jgi:fructokinase
MSDEILCVGEILWDALPDGLFLGGAPFNVACHLRALGEEVAFVSRVGNDVLGDEALRRLRAYGLDTDLMQVDESLPTGFVRVDLDSTGEPDYEIVEPAAWDAITISDALQQRAEQAAALVFGSLAQRAGTSRQTIRVLCEADVLRVFDINLRPPYVDRKIVEYSLMSADVVKLNDHELQRLRSWFGLPSGAEAAMGELATTFSCSAVCVTWGGEGARLWNDGQFWSHSGYSAEVEDTVGAGDAFLAALLSGLLNDLSGATVLDRANQLGAYVASRSGALPSYQVDGPDEIGQIAHDAEIQAEAEQ